MCTSVGTIVLSTTLCGVGGVERAVWSLGGMSPHVELTGRLLWTQLCVGKCGWAPGNSALQPADASRSSGTARSGFRL